MHCLSFEDSAPLSLPRHLSRNPSLPHATHIMRRGVPRRQTIRHAKSRQAYWHRAKTIASGVGMTNAFKS